MNKHELHGGARYLGGKAEKAIGDVADSSRWQVAGVVDQVAGAGENLFGRAQSVAHDVADAAPGLIDAAKDRATASDRAIAATRHSADAARRAADGADERLIWAGVAALGGYLLGWLIHRQA